MKSFATVQPDDAEVLRNGRWIRYDATSLVTGDVVRLEEGDLVPADCIVLLTTTDGGDENDDHDDDEELLVDLKAVTGHERLKAINRSTTTGRVQRQLYMGGKIVQGRGTAMVTGIGPRSLLGTLIRDGRFPPKEPVVLETLLDGGGGGGRANNDGAVSIQMGSMS
jgi:magnesium-transporting ATPase (P-type)